MVMRAVRIGLESTKIVLSKACQEWFVKRYPPEMIYEYELTGVFNLKSMGKDFVEITDQKGTPYRIPLTFDGEVSFRMFEADKDDKP